MKTEMELARRAYTRLWRGLYDMKRMLADMARAGYDIAPAWYEIDLTADEWAVYFTDHPERLEEYKQYNRRNN